MQSGVAFSQLTKCGEIYINDTSSDAYLSCVFCLSENEQGTKSLRSLKEFIDHIKWHRSEDFLCSKDDSTALFETIEVERANDLYEADDGDAIFSEPGVDLNAEEEESKEDFAYIADNVLIKIFDLFKKCPCLWHKDTATRDQHFIEPTYKMLTTYFNDLTKQFKSVEYVRDFLERVSSGFLEETDQKDDRMSNTSSRSSPWYFNHLMFLLRSEEKTLDESIYTDFECPICNQETCSSDELWDHLHQHHLELDEQSKCSSQNINCSQDEMQRDFLERFIEAYKNQPCLWDKRRKEYRNRKLSNESYGFLLRILKENNPAATRQSVTEKIKSLRRKFVYEKAKVVHNKLAGLKYKPTVWYYEKLLFLDQKVNTRPKSRTQKNINKNFSVNQEQQVLNSLRTCVICRKEFTHHTPCVDHMQRAHNDKAFQSADGYYYCLICNAQSKTKNAFFRHLRHSHTFNLKFCKDCGLKFRFMIDLAKHRAKVHKDYNPFKCEQCEKGFPTLSRMKEHCVIHYDVDDRPHGCKHCGKRFSNRGNLIVHVRRHTKDFFFKCEICNQKWATSSELRFHMLSHTKKFPFICDACGKGFRSIARLKTHQIESHGDEIFECELCDKQFTSERRLQSHLERHQPVEPEHVCKTCGKRFTRNQSLQKHIRQKHPDSLKEPMLFNDLIDEDADQVVDDE